MGNNTGQVWPKHGILVRSKSGKIIRNPNSPYDAHEIIPNMYGGPLEWWNIHSERWPNEHQGGIHRADGYGINYLNRRRGLNMSDFQFLKKYVFEEETDDIWSNKHVLFKVSESEIDDIEKKLDLKLPKELREFYKEIGYGFLNCGVGNNVNRIISPIEIYDFYLGINDYEGDIRREYYKDISSLIFFEVSADTFMTIDLKQVNDEGKCPVYYFKSKVSESIEEFIKKMELQNNFYKNT